MKLSPASLVLFGTGDVETVADVAHGLEHFFVHVGDCAGPHYRVVGRVGVAGIDDAECRQVFGRRPGVDTDVEHDVSRQPNVLAPTYHQRLSVCAARLCVTRCRLKKLPARTGRRGRTFEKCSFMHGIDPGLPDEELWIGSSALAQIWRVQRHPAREQGKCPWSAGRSCLTIIFNDHSPVAVPLPLSVPPSFHLPSQSQRTTVQLRHILSFDRPERTCGRKVHEMSAFLQRLNVVTLMRGAPFVRRGIANRGCRKMIGHVGMVELIVMGLREGKREQRAALVRNSQQK